MSDSRLSHGSEWGEVSSRVMQEMLKNGDWMLEAASNLRIFDKTDRRVQEVSDIIGSKQNWSNIKKIISEIMDEAFITIWYLPWELRKLRNKRELGSLLK